MSLILYYAYISQTIFMFETFKTKRALKILLKMLEIITLKYLKSWIHQQVKDGIYFVRTILSRKKVNKDYWCYILQQKYFQYDSNHTCHWEWYNKCQIRLILGSFYHLIFFLWFIRNKNDICLLPNCKFVKIHII